MKSVRDNIQSLGVRISKSVRSSSLFSPSLFVPSPFLHSSQVEMQDAKDLESKVNDRPVAGASYEKEGNSFIY